MSAATLAVSGPLPHDPECILLTPVSDVADPELSIVIPAMNERLTIADTIKWCQEGFRKANIVGEVLIIDSSADETPQIALEQGARVLKTPRRGLGRAYIDAIPYIRANYILMGDADCTYDFREIGGRPGSDGQRRLVDGNARPDTGLSMAAGPWPGAPTGRTARGSPPCGRTAA